LRNRELRSIEEERLEGPVLSPTCIGPGKAQTQILFYSIQHPGAETSCLEAPYLGRFCACTNATEDVGGKCSVWNGVDN